MEIRVLRYFLTIVREEGITKASEVLHITQPTLSRQIAQLEEEIGVKLFERGKGKIKLTSEGFLLRRRAEEILQLVDKTEKELIEQGEQIEGIVNIGCGELKTEGILVQLCGSFRKNYPNVHFDIYTATADVVRERMERGLIDIGLLLEPVDMERFEYIRLKEKENWCVMMSASDPLAKKAALTADDLKSLPLALPRRLNVQSELANWFGDCFKDLDIVFTGNLSGSNALIAEKGLAYPLTIEIGEPFIDNNKVVSRPLSPELTATVVLAWKRAQPFSPAVTRFIAYIKCFLGMD